MLPTPATGAIRSCRRWRRLYTLVVVVTTCFTVAAYTFFFSSTTPRTHLERTVRELRGLPNDFSLESQAVRHAKPNAWTITETLAAIDGLRHEFDKQERQGQMGYLERLAMSFSAGRNVLAVANPATYPSCGLSAEDKERYSELRQGGRVFVAINLLQNEELMPTLARQLLTLLEELGPARVFVSIYENASMDLTVMHLRLLCKVLDAVGTPYRIIARGLMELQQKEHGRRISRLAHLRNTVLEPLFLAQNSMSETQLDPFETAVFLNDVFFCHGDVLELLLQKKRNRAIQSCGLDFGPRGLVYDRWVLRTMRGTPIYRQKDLVEFFGPPDDIELKPRPKILSEKDDERDKATLDAGEPFQVFSCWNGLIYSVPASVFATPTSLRFRTAHNDPNSTDGATDKASECYLSSVDLWKADLGRVMVVPRARVAYSLDVYNADRASSAYNTPAGSPPLVEWSSTPPSEVVMHDFGLWFAPETKDAWDAA
ncbi:capsular associated protein [Ceratobasidium sp. 428]|nr:capsular associated protein [Ceratobasidium sp. 428]